MPIMKSQRNLLILDLAVGTLKAGELAEKYKCEVWELRAFVDKNREELEQVRSELDGNGLWVTNKVARLRRYQSVLEILLPAAYMLDPMVIREIRSYLNDVADELGQLLNRGAGENVGSGQTNYLIDGLTPEELRDLM